MVVSFFRVVSTEYIIRVSYSMPECIFPVSRSHGSAQYVSGLRAEIS